MQASLEQNELFILGRIYRVITALARIESDSSTANATHAAHVNDADNPDRHIDIDVHQQFEVKAVQEYERIEDL